jgi:hypothetical protein
VSDSAPSPALAANARLAATPRIYAAEVRLCTSHVVALDGFLNHLFFLCALSVNAGMVKTGTLTTEDVLRSEVPWPAFQSAGVITKDQLEQIYTLDKQEVSVQVMQFKAKGALLAQMFIDLVTGVNKDDAICYILAMLEQLMDADGCVALFFARLPCDSVTPFLKLLQRSSLFIVEKAACVVAKILATPNSSDEYLATFAAWTVATLKSVRAPSPPRHRATRNLRCPFPPPLATSSRTSLYPMLASCPVPTPSSVAGPFANSRAAALRSPRPTRQSRPSSLLRWVGCSRCARR